MPDWHQRPYIDCVMSYLTVWRRLEKQLAKASPGDPVLSENELARHHKVHRVSAA